MMARWASVDDRRDFLPWVIVFALMGVIVFMAWRYDTSSSEGSERRETLEAAIPTLRDQRDSARAVADSLRFLRATETVRYLADSVQWERDRANEQRIRAHDEEVLSNLADSIKSRVDSITAAMVTELQATHREVVRSLENEITTLEHTRDSLWEQRETLSELYDAAAAENAANRALLDTQQEITASWESAYRSERRAKYTVGGTTALALIGLVLLVK